MIAVARGEGTSGRTAVGIAPLTIDELSTARYIHARALKGASIEWASAEDRGAIDSYVYASGYGDALERAVRESRILSGRIGTELVGTCGWSPAADDGITARIRWCHVLPMFAGLGVGTALLAATETGVTAAGLTVLSARSSPDAARFFERAGYGITAHGVRAMVNGRTLPITYLRKRLGPTLVQPLF